MNELEKVMPGLSVWEQETLREARHARNRPRRGGRWCCWSWGARCLSVRRLLREPGVANI